MFNKFNHSRKTVGAIAIEYTAKFAKFGDRLDKTEYNGLYDGTIVFVNDNGTITIVEVEDGMDKGFYCI